MIVQFLRDQHVLGVQRRAWDEVDLDPDVGWDLIRRQVCRYSGDGINYTPVWDDYVVPASGINPQGSQQPPSVDNVETDWPGSLLYSGSADQFGGGGALAPHGWIPNTPIRLHIHWMLTANSALAVDWITYTRFAPEGEAASAWSSASAGVLEVDHGGVAEVHAITSFDTLHPAGEHGTVLWFRLERLGNTDANNDDARLISLHIHYQRNRAGLQTVSF